MPKLERAPAGGGAACESPVFGGRGHVDGDIRAEFRHLAQHLPGYRVDALSHLRPAMMQDEPARRRLFRGRVHFKVTIAGLGDAVADAGILDGAGDARPRVAAEGVAHREQGFAQGRAFAEHLPGW